MKNGLNPTGKSTAIDNYSSLAFGVEVSITVSEDVKDEQMMEFKNSILEDSRMTSLPSIERSTSRFH